MKNHNVLVAIIISAALLASAIIISSGLKTFGQSVERAGAFLGNGIAAQQRASIPSAYKLELGEIKIGNGGGAGQSFRVQTVAK